MGKHFLNLCLHYVCSIPLTKENYTAKPRVSVERNYQKCSYREAVKLRATSAIHPP